MIVHGAGEENVFGLVAEATATTEAEEEDCEKD